MLNKRIVKTKPEFRAKIVLKAKAWRERMYFPGESFIDKNCHEGKYKAYYGEVVKLEETPEVPPVKPEVPKVKATGKKGVDGLV